MVTVELLFTPEDVAKVKALEPMALKAFLERQGANMVAQVRRNIVAKGGSKSAWAPLNTDYAKRKKEGKTPGAGRFNYAMLRDTGSMYDGLTAVVTQTANEISVALTAKGQESGRPSNAELLVIHAEGKGRVPPRHPALPDEMVQFQARFAGQLDRFLDTGKDEASVG
jgi:hypothetical protein